MRRFLLHTDKGVYILLTLTAILWGGNAVTAKYTVGELPPVTTAFFRFAWVSVIMVALVLLDEGTKGLPTLRQWRGILGLGATGVFLNNFLFFTGVKYSTATNASLLAAANPVITALLAAVFLRERLSRRQLFGVLLSLAGVITIITKGDFVVLTGFKFNFGDILLALAPVSWATYSVIGRKLMKSGISALAATAWSSVVGSVLLLLAALPEGYTGSISLSGLGWVSMVYMIIGSGFLAFYWWNQGVSVIGPNRAAVFLNVIPLAGMFFASLLLKEMMAWQQAGGAALIIGGVFLTTQGTGREAIQED